jgi:hypothetical protein
MENQSVDGFSSATGMVFQGAMCIKSAGWHKIVT